jgi:hypothetical protein
VCACVIVSSKRILFFIDVHYCRVGTDCVLEMGFNIDVGARYTIVGIALGNGRRCPACQGLSFWILFYFVLVVVVVVVVV